MTCGAQREYEAERHAVDEIMRKIDEEDVADAAKRAAQQAATRAYIADFVRQQACTVAHAYIKDTTSHRKSYSIGSQRDALPPHSEGFVHICRFPGSMSAACIV